MMICELLGAQVVTFADTGVLIEVNGDAVDFNQNTGLPFIDQATRTQLSVKAVLEALGISVGWDGQ